MLFLKVNESPCVSGNRKKRLAGIRKTAGKEGQSMEKLQIVYLPPGDLKPYEKNARKHAPDDIEAIKKSILEDGFLDPVGVWGENNIIVEGHGRQIAALELGLESIPCVRLDHLTDKQRREYAIRHNRTAELSAWDFSKLEEECAALSIEGQDFPELNFTFDGNYGGDITTIDNTSKEYGEEDFSDDKFECECPRCGFKFNR